MKKAILVLGPPRSGTSALSHVLSKLGVDFGDPRRFVDPEVNRYNPIFFELQSLNDINDDIFRHFGKDWGQFDWLPERSDFDAPLISLFEPRIAQLLGEEFSDPQTIGLKDPRFCCTLPLWDAVLNRLGYAVSYAITRRSSDALFVSNQLLNQAFGARNFRLVVHSTLLAWHFVEGKNFVSVAYEDLLEDPDATIARLCGSFGLDRALASDAKSVLQKVLNHQKEAPRVSRYKYFTTVIDSDSISPDEHLRFREVYWAAASEKDQKIATLSDELSQREGQLAARNQTLSERDRQIADLDQAVSERDARIAALNADVSERDAQIAILDRTVLEFERSASWRMTGPVRIAMHHVLRLIKTVRMLAVLLFNPREVKWTILEVGVTSIATIEEQIRLLGSDQFALQMARERSRSPKVVREFLAFAILLLHLKRWWFSSLARARRSKFGRAFRVFKTLAGAFLRSPRRFIGSLANYAGSVANYVEMHAAANESSPFPLAIQSTSLPNVVPMNLRPVPGLEPRLNVIIPGLVMRAMSGGPNTAINLTYRLAHEGIPVRYISSDVEMEKDADLLWEHFSKVSGIDRRLSNVEIVSAHDRSVATEIGDCDVFFGTAWWTVQMIKDALPRMRNKRFLYLIQDFEPGLYAWSTRYALALETYSLDFYGIINSRSLSDFLFSQKAGRFADPAFAKQCLTFDPALDRRMFYPELSDVPAKRRLLFYARPDAPRNLFELGIVALQRAVTMGAFPADEWELLFIGDKLPSVNLGNNVVIRQAPWCNYDDYAKLLRSSTVGLSLMLSPHPSYPPLEMGMCGMLAVTSTYAPKTADLLRKYCQNVIPVAPDLESIVDGLMEAFLRSADVESRRMNAVSELPSTWDAVFDPLIPEVIEFWNQCLQRPLSRTAAA